jgi:hypothetical protein
MRFAKTVFTVAGIWGIVVLLPLYFLVDITGKPWPPPLNYPHFFYGFIGVALAWQLAFLIIGRNPERYRLLMIPAIIEKLGHVATVATLATLHARGAISFEDAMTASPDLILFALFVIAFVKTRSS